MVLANWFGVCAAAVLVISGLATPALADEAGTYKLAVTIDDLPSHGALPKGMTRPGIAKLTLDAYAAHKVPRVYGYINAGRRPSAWQPPVQPRQYRRRRGRGLHQGYRGQ
jgi:hypothetical protein